MSGVQTGMWVAFALLAGLVVAGFKYKELKWYEFIVSGLCVALLDGLVFKGAIVNWIGTVGVGVQNAVPEGTAKGVAFLFGVGSWSKAWNLVKAAWSHRPLHKEYIFGFVGVFIIYGLTGASLPLLALIWITFCAALTLVVGWLDIRNAKEGDDAGR